MADNIELSSGSGGAVVATDDDGVSHHQYVKLEFGADNTQTKVTAASPLPVDASGVAVPVTDNGGALTVDWAGTAPPIGAGLEATALRVTLATDSTGVVSIDDNGAGLTVDNAGTFAVQVDGDALTALQLIDNIVQVEDVGHSTGASGVMMLAVRNDTAAALAGTTGDYIPLTTDFQGRLYTLDGASIVDDAVFTPASSFVHMGGGLVDETSTDTLDEGDGGAFRLDTSRRQLMRIVGATDGNRMDVDASGHAQVDIAASSATVTVSGTQIDVDDLARTADTVSAALATDAIMDGATVLTPKFAIIDAATSGDNTLVTAVSGKKIRVLNVVLVASGTVTVRFESGAAGTALTGQLQLTAQTGFAPGFCPVGHFETAATTLLNLELSAAVSVDGWLVYVEV